MKNYWPNTNMFFFRKMIGILWFIQMKTCQVYSIDEVIFTNVDTKYFEIIPLFFENMACTVFRAPQNC